MEYSEQISIGGFVLKYLLTLWYERFVKEAA